MRLDLPQCNFKNCRFSFDGNCTNKIEYERCEYRLANDELDDVALVRHGRWEECGQYDVYDYYQCSECGYFSFDGETNYCPNCGAKMEGKNEDGID